MYNNREENIFDKRTTTVMDEERVATSERYASTTTQKPAVDFTAVTKNPSRLTVTNTGRQAEQTITTAKPKAKEKVQTKNIAMMVVYSVVAIALACVIAVNAITLGTLSATNAELSAELGTLETTYSALSTELSAVSSTELMTELASTQFDLTSTTAAATASFSVPSYVAVETQTFDNNWFDNMLDKLA